MKSDLPIGLALDPSVSGMRGLSLSFLTIAALSLPFVLFAAFLLWILMSNGQMAFLHVTTWLVALILVGICGFLWVILKLAVTHWFLPTQPAPIIKATRDGLNLRLHLPKEKTVFVPWDAVVAFKQEFRLSSNVPETVVIQLRTGAGVELRRQFGLLEGQIGHLRGKDLIRYPGDVFAQKDQTVGELLTAFARRAGKSVERRRRAGGLKRTDEWRVQAKPT